MKLAELKQKFDETVPIFENHFNIKADYTHDSLWGLEAAFDDMYPMGATPHPATVLMTSYYIGEVFIRNIPGAKWNPDVYQNSDLAVTFTAPGSDAILLVHPPEMVVDYIRDPRNSISKIFTYFKDVVEGRRRIEGGKITGDKPFGVGYTLHNGESDTDGKHNRSTH